MKIRVHLISSDHWHPAKPFDPIANDASGEFRSLELGNFLERQLTGWKLCTYIRIYLDFMDPMLQSLASEGALISAIGHLLQ